MPLIPHLIDGQENIEYVRTQPVYNPSTGKVSSEVALAGRETVKQAIRAAHRAFPEWRATPPAKRAQIMFRFRQLLQEHADAICQQIGAEHGKISHDAAGELQRGIENVEYACFAPELLKGEHSKNVGPAIDSWSEFQPLGVVAGITPFNFPVMVPLWMYPLAIVCGNTFVLKPSERDPSAALLVAQIAHEAGLPPGVLNVVHGDKEAVETLLTSSKVQAISFVGSTPIAETIYATATANGKRCQALGGAKNHAIIMPDADLDNAADALIGAAFGSSGERCMAISAVVAVGDAVADAFVEKMTGRMTNIKCGPATDANNDFGPLITAEHRDKVVGHIDDAERDGAEVVVDGRHSSQPQGFFVGATLLDRVMPEMRCYQEEIFGPVLSVVRVDTLQQAMDLIDQHEYGNGACLFTRDGEAARYFADNINIGMVGINVPLPVPVSYHSFGGWKRSLFGDLHAYGPDGVRFYTRRKTITQRWPSSGVREGVSFSFPS